MPADVLDLVKKENIPYVDRRGKKGCLWLIGSDELAPFAWHCGQLGIKFRFKPEGARATQGKSTWWTRQGLYEAATPSSNQPEAHGEAVQKSTSGGGAVTHSLREQRDYAYTKPLQFLYRGKAMTTVTEAVRNWKKLYVR